jgi:hypothetical protein
MLASKPITIHHSRLLLGLVLLALALQNVLWLVALNETDARWPDAGPIGVMGLAFGQSALGALLLAWGRGWLLVRGVLAIAMILAAACLANQATRAGNFLFIRVWISFMLAHTAVVAVPMVVARFAGLRLEPRGLAIDDDAGRAARRSAGRQFTIGELISLTTLVAVLLAIARWLEAPPGSPLEVALFALVIGTIPWGCALLALRPVSWWWPVLAGVVLCPLVGWLSALTGFPPHDPLPLVGLCCVEGAVLLAVCFVVRAAGYELAWHGGIR